MGKRWNFSLDYTLEEKENLQGSGSPFAPSYDVTLHLNDSGHAKVLIQKNMMPGFPYHTLRFDTHKEAREVFDKLSEENVVEVYGVLSGNPFKYEGKRLEKKWREALDNPCNF